MFGIRHWIEYVFCYICIEEFSVNSVPRLIPLYLLTRVTITSIVMYNIKALLWRTYIFSDSGQLPSHITLFRSIIFRSVWHNLTLAGERKFTVLCSDLLVQSFLTFSFSWLMQEYHTCFLIRNLQISVSDSALVVTSSMWNSLFILSFVWLICDTCFLVIICVVFALFLFLISKVSRMIVLTVY